MEPPYASNVLFSANPIFIVSGIMKFTAQDVR